MSKQTFTYLIGYIGLIPQYFQLTVPYFPGDFIEKIHPKHLSSKPQQNIMLSNRRKFYKVHKTKKISNNYEGNGKNYRR